MNLSVSLDGIFLVAMVTNIGEKYKLVHVVQPLPKGGQNEMIWIIGWGKYISECMACDKL